ncbi:MAG TPA: hypothetical protein VFX29_03345 [Longimicrobiaceae bacterium]|jgi:Na+-translocating ferredoxin:NAD+ oxidoreductase RnfD subunit|nr:hypothetical protein [Longimicrobiaceae bacterium]
MRILLIAAVLITLPAVAIIFYFFGTKAMLPAMASFLVNSLPFAVAILILRGRKKKGENIEIDH